MEKAAHFDLTKLVERCSGPLSRAWDVTDGASEMERRGEDIIYLGVGDPGFDTPKAKEAPHHRRYG